MKKNALIIKLIFISLIFILTVNVSGAETPSEEKIKQVAGYISGILNRAIGWLAGLLIAGSALVFLYAAFLYLTAGGDEEQIRKAKSVVWYAILAMFIAVISGTIVIIIKYIVGVKS